MVERNCTVCGDPIADARLRALPNTEMCVSCVQDMGDVAKIKRHDDWDMAMENCSETLYFENGYFEHSNKIRGQVGYTTIKEERMS